MRKPIQEKVQKLSQGAILLLKITTCKKKPETVYFCIHLFYVITWLNVSFYGELNIPLLSSKIFSQKVV